jgi:acetolactate synthase-1/3 small subunit
MRSEALRHAQSFGAELIDTSDTSYIFEVADAPGKIDAFIDLMLPLGFVEVSRTGVAAITRGAEAM